MKRLYWSGISREERIKAISDITTVINNYGTILNSSRFSDLDLNMVLEIKESKVQKLFTELYALMNLEGSVPENSDTENECTILINITFTRSSGNLRIEVPSVPG